MTEFEMPELPKSWQWAGGNRGQTYYDTFFETKYKQGGPYAGEYGLGGMHGCVFWDEGQQHTVQIHYVERIDEHGDAHYSYPILTESFDLEETAHKAVPDLIKRL